MCEEYIILHNVRAISSKSLLVHRDGVVEGDSARQSGLVDERDAIGKDVEQRGLACAGRTQNVGGLAGRAEAGTPFDNLLPSSFETVDGDLFLSGDHLDLENNVAPAEFDRVPAELLCCFDQLLSVNRFSRRQRLRAGALSVDRAFRCHLSCFSFFLLLTSCIIYDSFNFYTTVQTVNSVILSFSNLRRINKSICCGHI